MYYCKVLPKALLGDQGRGFFQKPVGTGPFKFSEWLRSPRLDILGVRLERNNAYFGKRPYLNAVDYSPYFTDDQIAEGITHIISVTSDAQLPARYQILENNSLRSAYLSFSCHIPPFDRAEVRRALSLGISNVRLAAALRSASSIPQVTQNFIPTMLPGFFPKDESPLYEPDKARILLARLLPDSAVNRLKLTLIFLLPKTDLSLQFSRELGREMDAMGIDLDVKYLRHPDDIQAVRGPYLKFLDWSMVFPDPENIIRPLFFSKSAVNLQNSHYANPALDALVDASEVETSWEKRIGLFRQMERILFDEVPAIPLYTERIRIALQPGVHGAALPALGFYFLDMKNIWLQD
jgi:ABC-type transport system substrate-binding protein